LYVEDCIEALGIPPQAFAMVSLNYAALLLQDGNPSQSGE
jgi:hypothetical protein